MIDSRGRIEVWDWLRRQPHWREVVAIGSETTPIDVRERWARRGLRSFFTSGRRVDLREAIAQLTQAYGAKRIRVESGGVLNGLMLEEGLIDEVAVLIHPVVVGGRNRRTMFCGPPLHEPTGRTTLKLKSSDVLDGGLIHVRYEVLRS